MLNFSSELFIFFPCCHALRVSVQDASGSVSIEHSTYRFMATESKTDALSCPDLSLAKTGAKKWQEQLQLSTSMGKGLKPLLQATSTSGFVLSSATAFTSQVFYHLFCLSLAISVDQLS